MPYDTSIQPITPVTGNRGLLLAGGIGQGLQAGIEGFFKARQMEDERKRQQITQRLLAKRAGYDLDEDGGLIQTDLGRARDESELENLGLTKMKAGLERSDLEAETNPDSPYAQATQAGFEKYAETSGLPKGLLLGQSPHSLNRYTESAVGKSVAQAANEDRKEKIADKRLAATLAATRMRQSNAENNLNVRDRNFAMREHGKVMARIDRDPTLRTQLGQITQLRNAMTASENAVREGKPITTEQFQEVQQAVLQAIGQKGQQAVAERNAKYLNSLGFDGQKMVQFLTGQPQDIGPDNPLYQHIGDLARWESENIEGQYQDQIANLTAGNEHIYDENPKLKAALQSKVDQLTKTAKGRAFKGIEQERGESNASGLLGKTPAGSPQPKPKTVIQNGHTYQLNEETGQYE